MPWRSCKEEAGSSTLTVALQDSRPSKALCDDFLRQCMIHVNFDLGVETWLLPEKARRPSLNAFCRRLGSSTSNVLAELGGHIVFSEIDPSLSVL